jgi:hypothetical protein
MYWAVSGNPEFGPTQDFRYVIRDQAFCDKHIYDYAPASFYSSNNSNPQFKTDLEHMRFDKKLLGLAIEKQCESMVALAPKMYTCFNGENPVSVRMKGVSRRLNHPTPADYQSILTEHTIKKGINRTLSLHNNAMCKLTIVKNMLTAAHTKMYVLPDFSSCAPLFLPIHQEEQRKTTQYPISKSNLSDIELAQRLADLPIVIHHVRNVNEPGNHTLLEILPHIFTLSDEAQSIAIKAIIPKCTEHAQSILATATFAYYLNDSIQKDRNALLALLNNYKL